MSNENNLVQYSGRSREEVEEINSKGGKKSGETRRKKRDMKAKMKMLLSLPPQNCEDFNSASEMGIEIEEIDNEMVMLIGLFNSAKSGNVNAVREIRNIMGADNSSAELVLKQKEFKLKEQAVKGNDTENKELNNLFEAIRESDKP